MKPDPTVWIYKLRDERGHWLARVVMTSDGYFSTVSDYGNYAFWWHAFEGDFRAFFAQCDDGYVLGKLAKRDYYDGEATRTRIREHILEYRRDGWLSKDRAREEWDLLNRCGVDSREDFARWYDETKFDDAAEFAKYDHEPDARMFAERVLPVLREALRKEMAAEKADGAKHGKTADDRAAEVLSRVREARAAARDPSIDPDVVDAALYGHVAQQIRNAVAADRRRRGAK